MSIIKNKQAVEPAPRHYRLGFDPIELHYYGGYMSYSTVSGDFIARPADLAPYQVFETVQVQVGEKQEIRSRPAATRKNEQRNGGTISVVVLTGETAEQEIVTVPVYETVRNDVTPAFRSFGKQIVPGDRVKCGFVSGTLSELTDNHFSIATPSGKHYFPWAKTTTALERA